MAIAEWAETWDGRQGSMAVDRGAGRARFVRNYTRVFRARTNQAGDGPLTVLLYPACPRLYSPYFDPSGPTYDAGALCTKLDPHQDQDDPFQWLLTAEYSSDLSHIAEEARDAGSAPANPQDSQSNLNPLLRPPKIKWGTSRFQRVWMVDLAGQPVVNSAGDPFDPPVTTDDDRPVLTVTRNLAAFDEGLAYKYRNAVNSDIFMGAPPGSLKIVGTVTADSAFENNLFYWTVTGSFEFKADLWVPYQVLDAGYHAIVGSTPQPIRLTDSNGQQYASPQLLDGNSRKLRSRQTATLTAGSNVAQGGSDASNTLGCVVGGPGIVPGTTVIGVNGFSLTLSQPATLSGTVPLTFAYYLPLILFNKLPFAGLGLI